MIRKATYRTAKHAVSSVSPSNSGIFALLLAFALSAFSAIDGITPNDAFNDGIDRTDPNFVTASLLVMSLGDELYSCEEYIAGRKEWT